MPAKNAPPPREIDLAHPSYQPNKAEKEEPIEFPKAPRPMSWRERSCSRRGYGTLTRSVGGKQSYRHYSI